MGACRYCNQSPGFLHRQHSQCRDLHAEGLREMVQLVAQAAGTASFDETALRNTLQAIASRARATPDDVSQAIADGWAQGLSHAMSDGTLTHTDEPNRHLEATLPSESTPRQLSITPRSSTY